jgi:hypothetical protein
MTDIAASVFLVGAIPMFSFAMAAVYHMSGELPACCHALAGLCAHLMDEFGQFVTDQRVLLGRSLGLLLTTAVCIVIGECVWWFSVWIHSKHPKTPPVQK